ncbi:hypothetical protein [Lelliottia wanjuensis]|uniref:hypothetical protein n=1 Tax=Lelliottia wanjuensis TaxID=3050585 RepID=UPI00254B2AB3|nr:hypothetical protein [Lelliottia sp. V86_10]MDK9585439.1 hypothetical protein [Lelliottia sp. V86_10]
MTNSKLTNLGLRRFALMRQQFIDAMFIEHGFITRKILMAALGIESAMASRDMAIYSALNDNVLLNHSKKRWEVTEGFSPVEGLLSINAADYLTAAGVVFGFELGDIPRTKVEFGVIK